MIYQSSKRLIKELPIAPRDEREELDYYAIGAVRADIRPGDEIIAFADYQLSNEVHKDYILLGA